MARGWESKAIEAQQEESAREKASAGTTAVTPQEMESRSKRATLTLARARVAADLERARTPAHRAMLQQAIDSLDRQLAE
jgi:hypothetical protein